MSDQRISALRAVAHPVRLRMLSLLTAEAMSAAEVARALDLTHANASYHLRVLLDAGELFVEGEEKIRGGTARRYRYRVGGNPEAAAGAGHSRKDAVAWQTATHTEVVRRMAHRVPGPGTSSDIETWVTPETWLEAVELVHRAMNLLHGEAKPPHTEGTIHVSASSTAFVMEDDA